MILYIAITTILLIIAVFFLVKFSDLISLQLEKWTRTIGKRIGPKFKWKHSLLIVEIFGASVIALMIYLLFFLSINELLKIIFMISFLVYSFFSGATIQFLEENNPSPFSLKRFILRLIENCYLVNRTVLILDEANSFIFWVMIPLSFISLILLLNSIITGYLYILTIAILLGLWTYLPNLKSEKALSKKNKVSAKKVLLYALITSWLGIESFFKFSSSLKNAVNEPTDINLIVFPVLVGFFLTFDRLLKSILDDYKLFKKQRLKLSNSQSEKVFFNQNRVNDMDGVKIIKDKQEYIKHFSLTDEAMQSKYKKDKQKNALDCALDIRKFEIDLYWKRATYFWAFIAASFTGYFLIITKKGTPDHFYALVVCILGVCFSCGWYFVNRGSKFWQENWEQHVDYLEDEVIGPLYKTIKDPSECNIWKPLGDYPFSVSRINQLLSVVVAIIWTVLAYKPMVELLDFSWWQIIFCEMGFVIVISAIFIKFGKSGILNKRQYKRTGKFIMRDFR